MSRRTRAAMLGGGVAGVTAAMILAGRKGMDVELFESEDSLGGLMKSIEVNHMMFDIGAFFFPQPMYFLQLSMGLRIGSEE